jgi:hypothetical protein
MLPVIMCNHWVVEWIDAYTCCCKGCGRLGQWYDDGFVLWCRWPRTTRSVRKLEPAMSTQHSAKNGMNREA